MRRLFALLLLVMTATPPAPAQAQRAIPDDNLAYPVLASHAGGSGSGFFMNGAVANYFVTARHVLYDRTGTRLPSVTLTAYGRDIADPTKFVLEVDLAALHRGGRLLEDAAHDVAVVRIGTGVPATDGKRAMRADAGVTVKSIPASGFVGVSAATTVKRFSEVMVSNKVMIFGYPRSIGIQTIPQFDPDRPLLRSGIVAGKNEATRRAIIIDCPSYPGNSGGPVVEIHEDGFNRLLRVIGVVVEFVPSVQSFTDKSGQTHHNITNSGYTVVAPMDPVLTLVEQLEKQKP
jgi:hypothetical protein